MAQGDLARVRIKAEDESKGGFDSFLRNAQSASRGAEGFHDGLGRLNGMLGTLGITLSVGAVATGFAALIKNSIDAMANMHELSQRTGVTVETLSGLELVAKQSGTSMDDVAKITQKLSRNMLEFVRDGGSKVGESFKSIGLSQADVQKGMSNMDTFLPAFAGKLLDSASGARQVAIAQELMGKSGANALPFLHQLAETQQLMARYTGENAARADDFLDRLEKLKFQSGQFGITLANDLLPWLNDVVKAMIKGQEEGGKFQSILRGIQAAAGVTNPDLAKYNREQVGLVDALMVTERQRGEIESGQKPNRIVAQGVTMLDALQKREREIRERLTVVQSMRTQLEAEEAKESAVTPRARGASTEDAQNRGAKDAADARAKMLENYRKLDAAGWVKYVEEQIDEYERGLREEARLTEEFYKKKEKLTEADMRAWFAMIDAAEEFEIAVGAAMTTETTWATQQREQLKKQTEEQAKEAQKFADDLNRSITDALFRGFESGKGFGQNFFDTLKNAARSLVLQPILKFVLSPITGPLSAGIAGLGIPGLGNASTGDGGISNLLSGASSLNSLFGGVSGAGSFASGFGATAFADTAAAAAMIEGGTVGMAGLGMEAGAGILGGLGGAAGMAATALPYVGIALAAYSLLRSKKTPAVGQGYNFSGSIAGGSLEDIIVTGLTNKGQETPGSQRNNAIYSGAFSGFGANLERMLAPIIGADAARGVYSTNASFGFSQGMGVKDPETAVQLVRSASNAIIGQLAPGIREMAQANEELIDTLNRVSTARRSANLDGIFARMNGIVSGTDDVAGLFLSDLSPLTARERLERAQGLYQQNVAGVRAGDLTAIGNYAGVTRAYASEARSFYASSPDYTSIFNELQSNNTDLLTETLTEQSIQFAAMGLTLKDIADKVQTMDARVVEALERASAANLAALEAIVQAQSDAAQHIVESQETQAALAGVNGPDPFANQERGGD